MADWENFRGTENYEINTNLGQIRHKKNKIVLGKEINSGYFVCSINRKIYPIHRAVWYHVHGDIPENNCISHIDKVKSNNKIGNLELLSKSGIQLKRANNPNRVMFRNDIEFIDVDDFVPLRQNENYLIDPDAGTIIHALNRKMIGVRNMMNNYKTLSVRGKTEYLHRLVYEHVNGNIPDNCEIDHINGDVGDNRIANLQCLTRSEHRRKTAADRVERQGRRLAVRV